MTRHETFFDQSVTVRFGVPDDIHECMKLALMACEENAVSIPNPGKLLNNIWAALNLDFGLVGVIGDVGQPLEGIVLLRIGPLWYSDEVVLEEKSIFVHPSFRQARGGRAARLCEFCRDVSDKLGMPLAIGVLSSERAAGKVRMYTRYFGEPNGAYWLYRAKTGLSETEMAAAN